MNRHPSIALLLWLLAMTILMVGGCGQKKSADGVAQPAPVQQPVSAPAPGQPDTAASVQPTTPAESPAEPTAAEPQPIATEEPAEPTEPPAQPATPSPPAQPVEAPSAPVAPAPAAGTKPAQPQGSTPVQVTPEKQPATPAKAQTPTQADEAGDAGKPAPATPAPATSPPKPQGTVVLGTIQIVSHVPDPSAVPYDTCVTFIKYRVSKVISGSYDGDELLAVLWGMKAGKLQPAAHFTTGQTHRLTIEPFDNHQDLARVMQADDTNEYSLTPYWVISYSAE